MSYLDRVLGFFESLCVGVHCLVEDQDVSQDASIVLRMEWADDTLEGWTGGHFVSCQQVAKMVLGNMEKQGWLEHHLITNRALFFGLGHLGSAWQGRH